MFLIKFEGIDKTASKLALKGSKPYSFISIPLRLILLVYESTQKEREASVFISCI